MLDWFHITLLAFIQGFTEFLPISSSGHTALLHLFIGVSDQDLLVDVAAHFGSLIAISFYFRAEIYSYSFHGASVFFGKSKSNNQSKIFFMVLASTIFVGLAGLVFENFIETNARGMNVVASMTILFGIFLGLSDRYGRRSRTLDDMRWLDVFFIGLAQALALIPGVSRSGVTITMALFLGFNRVSATKFSFLLAIPVIALASIWKFKEFFSTENLVTNIDQMLYIVSLSALVSWLSIHFLFKFLSVFGLSWFALYRIALGSVLLLFF